MITRSGSLHRVNLGHDNSCNAILWILKGYTGFKKQFFSFMNAYYQSCYMH